MQTNETAAELLTSEASFAVYKVHFTGFRCRITKVLNATKVFPEDWATAHFRNKLLSNHLRHRSLKTIRVLRDRGTYSSCQVQVVQVEGN